MNEAQLPESATQAAVQVIPQSPVMSLVEINFGGGCVCANVVLPLA
jgi:hypothetical protein